MINKIFRLEQFVNNVCGQAGLSEHNANQVKAKCRLRGLAFKPYPLCVPAKQAAAGFPFVWKESKDGRCLCFSKDLNIIITNNNNSYYQR